MINCIEYTQKRIALSCCIAAFVTFGPGLMNRATAAEKPSWEMVKGDMVTRWAKEVSPTNALPEYPRPMMRRRRWKNLNGLWEFTMRPKSQASRPDKFDDHILVPFCIEAAKVYINGQLVLDLSHTSNFYTWHPMNEKMLRALKTGTNLIAVHCHNEHYPQYIDVGIVDVTANKEKNPSKPRKQQ